MARAVPVANVVELPSTYSHCIERTRQALHLRLANAPAADVLREYFARGKMLRAFLVFASSASVGGDPEDVVIAAEAIELLHGASLFHDDIIDGASARRGLASLHERLGMGQALVVGDDLLLRAFATLNEARVSHTPAQVAEATDALNQLAIECCRGQFEELSADRWISEEQYLAIVQGKTAAPFVAAGVLGVLLGGGTSAHLAQIRVYARQIGLAFQIGDDLLDLVGEAGVLGKPAGNSLARGRPMLPLIYLSRIAGDGARNDWSRLVERGWPRDEVVEALQRHGVIDRVRDVQRRHLETALGALEGLPNATAVEALRALAACAGGTGT